MADGDYLGIESIVSALEATRAEEYDSYDALVRDARLQSTVWLLLAGLCLFIIILLFVRFGHEQEAILLGMPYSQTFVALFYVNVVVLFSGLAIFTGIAVRRLLDVRDGKFPFDLYAKKKMLPDLLAKSGLERATMSGGRIPEDELAAFNKTTGFLNKFGFTVTGLFQDADFETENHFSGTYKGRDIAFQEMIVNGGSGNTGGGLASLPGLLQLGYLLYRFVRGMPFSFPARRIICLYCRAPDLQMPHNEWILKPGQTPLDNAADKTPEPGHAITGELQALNAHFEGTEIRLEAIGDKALLIIHGGPDFFSLGDLERPFGREAVRQTEKDLALMLEIFAKLLTNMTQHGRKAA